MAKTLDKMTKSELLAHIVAQQAELQSARSAVTRLQGSIEAADALVSDLSNQLTTLERRRLNEGNGYRKTIATLRGQATGLTRGQIAIREHRAQQS